MLKLVFLARLQFDGVLSCPNDLVLGRGVCERSQCRLQSFYVFVYEPKATQFRRKGVTHCASVSDSIQYIGAVSREKYHKLAFVC